MTANMLIESFCIICQDFFSNWQQNVNVNVDWLFKFDKQITILNVGILS